MVNGSKTQINPLWDYTTTTDMAYTTDTFTVNPPTKEECISEITHYLTKYSEKKWWQSKKHLLKSAIRWVKEFNNLKK